MVDKMVALWAVLTDCRMVACLVVRLVGLSVVLSAGPMVERSDLKSAAWMAERKVVGRAARKEQRLAELRACLRAVR